MSRVLIPGSFDPVHLGHLDVIGSAHQLFGTVVVGVLHNPSKPSGLLTPQERVELVRASCAALPGLDAAIAAGHIEVRALTGLAVQAAVEVKADFIVKGLRTAGDFEIEQQMAHNNQMMTGIRTVYVPCRGDLGHISSRFVREIAAQGGAINHLVAAPVARALNDRFAIGAGQ
jgi:pantetheine-phosphate adenylyltransferase